MLLSLLLLALSIGITGKKFFILIQLYNKQNIRGNQTKNQSTSIQTAMVIKGIKNNTTDLDLKLVAMVINGIKNNAMVIKGIKNNATGANYSVKLFWCNNDTAITKS